MEITRKQKTNSLMLVTFITLVCAFIFKDAGPMLFLVAFLAAFLAGFVWSIGLHTGFDREESQARGKQ